MINSLRFLLASRISISMAALFLAHAAIATPASPLRSGESDFEKVQALYDSGTIPSLSDLGSEVAWKGVIAYNSSSTLPGLLPVYTDTDPLLGSKVFADTMGYKDGTTAKVSVNWLRYVVSQSNGGVLDVRADANAAALVARSSSFHFTYQDKHYRHAGGATYIRKNQLPSGEPILVTKVVCEESCGCENDTPYSDVIAFAYYYSKLP